MPEVFDIELDEHLDSLDQKSECAECGEPIDIDEDYCSFTCFDSSHR